MSFLMTVGGLSYVGRIFRKDCSFLSSANDDSAVSGLFVARYVQSKEERPSVGDEQPFQKSETATRVVLETVSSSALA
jgi:hypothetical protein